MQTVCTALVLILFIGIALLGFYGQGGRNRNGGSAEATPIVLERVTQLAELTVLIQEVSKVHVTRIGGYTGAVEAVVVVNGSIEVSTDLQLARWEDVDKEARSATLVLAQPLVQRARLDHENTHIALIKRKGAWAIVPSSEPSRVVLNKAYLEAQECVELAGNDPQLLERSRHQTQQILSQFMGSMKWNVNIIWSEE